VPIRNSQGCAFSGPSTSASSCGCRRCTSTCARGWSAR
jgi:hypothetical protein